MDKIIIEKHFDKSYFDKNDNCWHFPIKIVQKRENFLGLDLLCFCAYHIDDPLKGAVPDKLIKNRDIVVSQEKLSDLIAHLKHDGEFRHFKYHIVEFKLHKKWEKDHKNEIEIVNA